jgi:hypothetical protein
MDTAQEVRPLTSSPPSRGQSLGGALWRAGYIPGDSNHLGVLHHLCTVPVYKVLFIRQLTSAVVPLVVLASTAGSKVINVQRFSVIAITLRDMLLYCITLYNSVAKLSFLNVIALGTQEPLSRLKVITLSKFKPSSLLKVIALRTWHKR